MEHDALVFEYSHLKGLPREKEALHSLRKIASLVKPIMRARSWKVGTLAEFFPDQQNLLGEQAFALLTPQKLTLAGINMNRGQKICLRLRYPGDKNQFLPLEQVVDTMLHELSHNIHGPHDAKFHALWDQLRKEYEGLLSKGYTGEGFLSDGRVLGGRRIPRDEATRIARAAAEKRRTLNSGSGQRLGGAPVRVGTDIRTVILNAIERRNTVLKGCGSDQKSEKEIKDLADQATNNGFKTKAEEDEANDRAIAQALWDLVQEDQRKEYGESYIPSTPSNPTGNGGGDVRPERSIKSEGPSSSASPLPAKVIPDARAVSSHQPPRHVSRLVTENEKRVVKKTRIIPKKEDEPPAPDPPSAAQVSGGWTCHICTLHNPIDFLCCDACTTERPEEITRKLAENEKESVRISQSTGVKVDTWRCHMCSTIMESKWWICSTCGVMKQSS
jgi:hypothetical protein